MTLLVLGKQTLAAMYKLLDKELDTKLDDAAEYGDMVIVTTSLKRITVGLSPTPSAVARGPWSQRSIYDFCW